MRRNKTYAIFGLGLLLLVALLAVGCAKTVCENHVDENKDGVCDLCEESVICSTHTDGDGNLTCDVCGIAITPICDLHTDADGNLTCDVCGAAVTATCDPHKDVNADRMCDTCGSAIVVITEYIAPKEEVRVAPVVNAIPVGVPLASYLKTKPTGLGLTVGVSLSDYAAATESGRYLYATTLSEGGTMTTHLILDLATGEEKMKTLLPSTTAYGVTLYDGYYCTRTRNEEGATVYSYYSYGGTCFLTDTVPAGGSPMAISEDRVAIPGCLRLSAGGKYYVLSGEKYLLSLDVKTYVPRPTFEKTRGGYGYLMRGGVLYAYDLSEWIDCAVSYEIPSYYENVRWFVLENGCALLQAEVRQSDRSGEYDFLRTEGSEAGRYDLRYVMIDPMEGTATEVEFGYWIESVRLPDGGGIFADGAYSMMTVYPIEEDRINRGSVKELLVDNDLGVLMDCGAILQAPDGIDSVRVVGENLYLITTDYDNGTIRYVVKEKGERMTFLPEDAVAYSTYVEYRGDLYDYKMEPLAVGYTTEEILASGARLLSKGGVYYFFAGAAPVTLSVDHASLTLVCEAGYGVSGTVEGQTVYHFYNAEGKKLFDAADEIVSATPVAEGANAYFLTDAQGNRYLVR